MYGCDLEKKTIDKRVASCGIVRKKIKQCVSVLSAPNSISHFAVRSVALEEIHTLAMQATE